MSKKQREFDANRRTYEITFPVDVSPEQVLSFIYSLGGTNGRGFKLAVPTSVFEVVSQNGVISHRLRVPNADSRYVIGQLVSSVPGLDYRPVEDDDPAWDFDFGVDLSMSAPDRMLQIADGSDLSSRILSAMQGTEEGESIVVQWVISPTTRNKLPTASAKSTKFNWVDSMLGLNTASPDEVATRRAKLNEPNFLIAGRVAAKSKKPRMSEARVADVVRSLRAESGPHTSFQASRVDPAKLGHFIRTAATPSQMRLQFTASELMPAIGWPLGKGYFPGLVRRYTRHFPAPETVPREGIVLGRSTMPGSERPIAMSYKGSTMHTALFGSNGTGKTTVAVSMADQAMQNGNGLLVIEADGDLIARTLDHVPAKRADDVIVLDFADDTNFVGLNLLDLESPEHAASRLVTIFEAIYESQSINTRVLLGHALRALGGMPGATIVDLPVYLMPQKRNDVVWAKSVDDSITDPEVKAFMAQWRSDLKGRSQSARLKDFEPLHKRLYELLLPMQSRYTLNQPTSAFNPRDVLENNKIVLVNLKGVPETVASVIGSLLVGLFWDAARQIKPDKPNYLMVDECHLFTKQEGLVIDALATARKRNLGLVLATQYPERLSRELRNAIGTNARTQLSFACGPNAARELSGQFGDRDVTKELLQNLEQFHAVGRVMTDDGQSPVISLKTLPERDGYGMAGYITDSSNRRYARTTEEIERLISEAHRTTESEKRKETPFGDEEIVPFNSDF
ncbi:type IV secretion system DNA-binding domain-containing protein [Rhodococcus hoagii]|nr:type IV secretion system DNA-binding domain-containing protein [Prescottella equi]